MVHPKILKKFNSTKERIREVFTASEDSDDFEIREKFQDLILDRLQTSIDYSVKQSHTYMAVDMAWDSAPVVKENLPLMLYAQKKIDFKTCKTYLSNSEEDSEAAEALGAILERDPKTDDIKGIDIPRLFEVNINLVRSYITRRLAAQASRFSNLFPYFKYLPRGTALADRLRADVLSQRVEIMSDQYNYRHFFDQCIRDILLYGHVVAFPTSSWDVQKQMKPKKLNSSFEATPDEIESESFVMKEGIDFVNPHPTRVFWDHAYPLANLNSDTGPSYVGYWDIVRWRDLQENSMFFNRDAIEDLGTLSGMIGPHSTFFNNYFDPDILKFPDKTGDSVPLDNDREANVGRYSYNEEDQGVFLTQFFIKVVPKQEGLGDYPYPVWMRLVVANENTVIYGEFLPSVPAIYGGVNENDNRLVNISMAHELMPFQDQLSNILSQMLMNMKAGLTQLWLLDQDIIADKVTQDKFKADIQAENYYSHPHILFYSATRTQDMGFNIDQAVKIVQVSVSEKISEALRAIGQILSLAERMLILSPQELGQPAPREITATEASEIANTTNSIFTFIANGIDELRAGAKQLIYESLITSSQSGYEVPVVGRYSKKTVEQAGFEFKGEADSSVEAVLGRPQTLEHDYLFNSRDGFERPLNSQSAQTLTQLLGIPFVQENMTREKMFEMINEIFRMSGAGFDLNLELGEREESLPPGTQQEQTQQIIGALQELAQRLQIVEQATGINNVNTSTAQQ